MDRACLNRKYAKKKLTTPAKEVFMTGNKLRAPYCYLIALGIGRNPKDALPFWEQQRIIYTVPKSQRDQHLGPIITSKAYNRRSG
jgi:hypothetical protein